MNLCAGSCLRTSAALASLAVRLNPVTATFCKKTGLWPWSRAFVGQTSGLPARLWGRPPVCQLAEPPAPWGNPQVLGMRLACGASPNRQTGGLPRIVRAHEWV
jgi:hypothetical protein